MNSLTDVRDKYLHDVSYINDYVQYLETFFITSISIGNNFNIVSPTFFSNVSIKNICDNTATIRTEMQTHLRNIDIQLSNIHIEQSDDNKISIMDPSPEGDLLLFLTAEANQYKDKKSLIDLAQSIVEGMCMTKGPADGFEGYYFLYDHPEKIEALVDLAIEKDKHNHYRKLESDKTYTHMSLKALDLFDSSNQINLYKQNFIQIMAYFDSCIFEMVRLCMKQKFFQWLAYFDNVNVKTYDIAACNDFDSFKDTQIESFLKKCYVKDLLNILHNKFSGVFIINGTDTFAVLQEMIGRRNVHIHHNGIADQMYLDSFNIYGASSGDYLKINKEYFENAVDLTKEIVSSIASICL